MDRTAPSAQEMADAVRRVVADPELHASIRQTQAMLGAIIAKCVWIRGSAAAGAPRRPSLTTRMLSRPPVAFLHAVFCSVRDATGFGEGLLEDDDAVPTSRSEKLRFLVKLIGCVAIALSERELEVKAVPLRLASGKDPKAANVLLQALARAAQLEPKKANGAVARAVQYGEAALYQRSISMRKTIAKCQARVRGLVARSRQEAMLSTPDVVATHDDCSDASNEASDDVSSNATKQKINNAAIDLKSDVDNDAVHEATAAAAAPGCDEATQDDTADASNNAARDVTSDAENKVVDDAVNETVSDVNIDTIHKAAALAAAVEEPASPPDASNDAANDAVSNLDIDAVEKTAVAAAAEKDAREAAMAARTAAVRNRLSAKGDAATAAIAAEAALEYMEQKRMQARLQTECRARLARLRAKEDHVRVQQSMLDCRYEQIVLREEKAKKVHERAQRELKKIKPLLEREREQRQLLEKQELELDRKRREFEVREARRRIRQLAAKKPPSDSPSTSSTEVGAEYTAFARQRLRAKELKQRREEDPLPPEASDEEPTLPQDDIQRTYEALGGGDGVFGSFVRERMRAEALPHARLASDDRRTAESNDGATASCGGHDSVKSRLSDQLPVISAPTPADEVASQAETKPAKPKRPAGRGRDPPPPRKKLVEGGTPWLAKFDKDFSKALKILEEAR